jgi:ribosomal protein S18 acetylase RimI-like enzyme
MVCCCSSNKVVSVGELPQEMQQLARRSRHNAKAASEVLTRAFAGDASNEPDLAFDWCLNELQGKGWDDPKRQASLAWIFRFIVEEALASGRRGTVLVFHAGDGAVRGVAVLKVHRSKPKDSVCAMASAGWRAGYPSADAEQYTFSNPRMRAMEGAQKRLHCAHACMPHVYVWALAVDPSAQGQGIGSRLMHAAVSIADREGLACYLETCGDRNQKVYAKHGFSVVGQEKMSTKPKKGHVPEVFEHPYLAMVRPAGGIALGDRCARCSEQ